jgi:hypothetical protein
MKRQFDGKVEGSTQPRHLSGKDVHAMVKDINVTYGKTTKVKGKPKKAIWKKRSIF